MAKNNTKYPKIGTIRKGTAKNDPKNTWNYIQLEDNVEIFVDGKKVELNKYRQLKMQKPAEVVERLMELGVIDEQKGQERLEKLTELPWLLYDISSYPDKAD